MADPTPEAPARRRPRAGVLVLAAVLAALGVAIAVSSGWRGLFVYAFFVLLAAALTFGLRIGGDFLTGASRGRFDRRNRR